MDRRVRYDEAPRHAPEPVSLTTAALRNWWLVLLPVVLLVAAGVALGMERKPEYRAQAQLNVGSINARVQAVPGYVEAAKSLSSAYSRIATTDKVLAPVARKTQMSVGALRGAVTVTPVVSNPLITVKARAGSEAEALSITRAMTDQLTATVRQLSTSSGDANRLLDAFKTATRDEQSARAKVSRLQLSGSPSALRDARADLAAASLKAQAAGQQYQQATSTGGGIASGIELLDPPRSAGSDRNEKLQQLAFVGLAAGLIIGLALALARETRRRRRAY